MGKTKFCVALGYSGKIIKKTSKSCQILSKKFNVKYVSYNNCAPNITLSGDLYLKKQTIVYEILKKYDYLNLSFKRDSNLNVICTDKETRKFLWSWARKLDENFFKNMCNQEKIKFLNY